MKRELRRWEIVGFIATGLFGTLLHFVYEWTGGNRVIAVFSAVNESTWEHMKLLFIPFLVFTVVEFIVFSEAFRNFFAVNIVTRIPPVHSLWLEKIIYFLNVFFLLYLLWSFQLQNNDPIYSTCAINGSG